MSICQDWKVREPIWQELSSALASLKNIYIWGSSGTGKTFLSKSILSFFSINHFYINCIEHFTFKSLFKSLKSFLISTFQIPEFKTSDPLKFALYLSQVAVPNFYIILDKAEKLLEFDLLFINKLQEFSLISKITLRLLVITGPYIENLFIHPDTIDRDFHPVKVHLAEYSPDQLRSILRSQYPYGEDRLFAQFFELLNQFLSPYTSKIFHFQQGFNKSYELFLNIDQTLPKEIKYAKIARELGSIEKSFFQKSKINKEYQYGLSAGAKVLVVSAFICSKNSPKTDLVLLKGKKRNEKRKFRQEFTELTVPEKFTLQRLQAVYSILSHLYKTDSQKFNTDSDELETPTFCSLVNTMTQKKLLVKVSKKDPLSGEKFMCTAEYVFCRNLASEIGVKLEEHVIDLN